nr:MAG TPA: hypothetical protein [Caudoviricetes sp.]
MIYWYKPAHVSYWFSVNCKRFNVTQSMCPPYFLNFVHIYNIQL